MNICVTGGAGFIGSHLVDVLVQQGHEVLVIDNLTTGVREFVNKEARFLEMDIRAPELEQVFRSHKIEYVFHEAAQTMVTASMEHPALDCDVNLMGLINILEACRLTGVKKLLMPSSAAVYGNNDNLPLPENEQGVPASFYGLTKLTGEAYLRLYEQYFKLPYICFRYANVYGPRQGSGGEGGVISIFAERIVHDMPIAVYGDGLQTRDFVYVDDVVEANLAGLNHPEVTGVFNVATNEETSLNELIEAFKMVSGKQFPVLYEDARPGDIARSRLSDEKAKNELEFQAGTNLTTGLLKTYHYFVEKVRLEEPAGDGQQPEQSGSAAEDR